VGGKHNDELRLSIVKRWGGAFVYGEKRTAQMTLLGKHEGKKPLERSGRNWEDNTKIYFSRLNAEFNPIWHLLALLVAHHILAISLGTRGCCLWGEDGCKDGFAGET